jgi:hypothetical protein
MFNVKAIQEYSSAAVLHPKPDTYFADLRHVCEFIEENMHVRVQAKTIALFLL